MNASFTSNHPTGPISTCLFYKPLGLSGHSKRAEYVFFGLADRLLPEAAAPKQSICDLRSRLLELGAGVEDFAAVGGQFHCFDFFLHSLARLGLRFFFLYLTLFPTVTRYGGRHTHPIAADNGDKVV